DIHRLRLLQTATRFGRSIGQVAALPLSALEELVADDLAARTEVDRERTGVSSPAADVLGPAMTLTRALDGDALESLLRRAATLNGVPHFLERVVAPLLRQIGDEWHAGKLDPAQEHLASATVQYVLEEITRAAAPASHAPGILITTPAGERHQIGAALAGVTAAAAGWRVTYLGPDLPAAEIARAAIAVGVQVVAISTVYAESPAHVIGELTALRLALPATVALVAGGAGAVAIARKLERDGIQVVGSLTELRSALESIGPSLK
ncbi:MAG: cobalamin-dependent protein, partial [Gemmatimonadota bacterium]